MVRVGEQNGKSGRGEREMSRGSSKKRMGREKSLSKVRIEIVTGATGLGVEG